VISSFGLGANDTVDVFGTPVIGANTSARNGTDSTYAFATADGNTVASHSISNGIIRFDDQDNYSTALGIGSQQNLAAVVDYLTKQNFGDAGTTLAFTSSGGSLGTHTYVYTQETASAGGAYTLVDLVGVTATSLTLGTGSGTALQIG